MMKKPGQFIPKGARKTYIEQMTDMHRKQHVIPSGNTSRQAAQTLDQLRSREVLQHTRQPTGEFHNMIREHVSKLSTSGRAIDRLENGIVITRLSSSSSMGGAKVNYMVEHESRPFWTLWGLLGKSRKLIVMTDEKGMPLNK